MRSGHLRNNDVKRSWRRSEKVERWAMVIWTRKVGWLEDRVVDGGGLRGWRWWEWGGEEW